MANCYNCIHEDICQLRTYSYCEEKVKEKGCKHYQPKIDKDKVVLYREEFLNLTPKRKKILANRVYEDSTLMTWTKTDLIEHIRILEQNWIGSLETIDIQAKNCEMLLKQASKETAEKFASDLKNSAEIKALLEMSIMPKLFKTIYNEIVKRIDELAKQFGVDIKEEI